MSENGHDDHDVRNAETLHSAGEGLNVSSDSAITLNSEAMAHLQIQWDQFSAHANNFALSKSSADHIQLVDDLKRIRNTLVVSEKPALEYVIRELLGVFDKDLVTHVANDNELARVLRIAVVQIGKHVRLMHDDVSLDNALALVPLINDCRACCDDMLLSDSLMLSAGVRMPDASALSATDESWGVQRQIWIDFATARHAKLARRMLHWWQKGHSSAVAPMIIELDRFTELTTQHEHLQTLVPLFQAASVVAKAVQHQQLDEGPALRGLYAQLERNVHRVSSVTLPEDLLPGDLLRNFLYYVAQTTLENETAVELRHRFRLDRVRQVVQVKQMSGTPTIGVVYHLTNAIRNSVASEAELLRMWIEAGDNQTPIPKFARLRVRLGQLEPILTLIGDTTSVRCLQRVQSQLRALNAPQTDIGSLQKELSQSLLQLDGFLDQSARRSVLSSKSTDAVELSRDDVYFDMAKDACLREARYDLQRTADCLLPMIRSRVVNLSHGHNVIAMLNTVDGALQMLELSRVSTLFSSLAQVLGKLFPQAAVAPADMKKDALHELELSQSQPLYDVLNDLLVSLDNYLGCVFLAQPAANQFLTDAQEMLFQLKPIVDSIVIALQADSAEIDVQYSQVERWFDDLSVEDSGSLTLNIDDDFLLPPVSDYDQPQVNNSLKLVFIHECLGHLETLDKSVVAALKPSSDAGTQLPNEQMLRALHTLTGSAQTVSAADVVAIAQPLQRASLALHREGSHFNGAQTRIVGDLVLALRSRLNRLSGDESEEQDDVDIEKMLSVLLSQTVSGMQQPGKQASSQSALTISAQVSSLNDVFAGEATLILDQMRDVFHHVPFDDKSVTEALSLLHTLKGSARIAGKQSICDCAHALENEVQSLLTAEERLKVFEQGCQLLQDHLMQLTFRPLASTSSAISVQSRQHLVNTGLPDIDDAGPRKLMELSSNLAFNQARVTDELAHLASVCDEIQSGAMRLRELRRNSDLPASPAVNEIIADMESSRMVMLDALRQTQREHQQSSTLGVSLQQAMVRSHLVRFDQMRERLADTIDDVAEHHGVSARLQVSGGELMIDRRIYRQLVAPLEHLARNAVVHGIESGEQRRLSGKTDVGLISLDVSVEGSSLVLCFSDDGRGIDPVVIDALQRDAVKRGSPADSDVHELLLSEGFSSFDTANIFAGHGLGLTAVQTMVEQMGGQVFLAPVEASGFSVTLRIPQQLFVNQVILVESGELLYGIPVAQTLSVQLVKEDSDGATLDNGENSPSVALHTLLGKTKARSFKTEPLAKPSIWVGINGESLSVEVDKVYGYRELVVQHLGPQIDSLGSFSAGSVLNGHQQVLIVNLERLVGKAVPACSTSLGTAYDACRPMALVVDDSPTTCRMARSILSSRGIDTSICRDGLEALEFISRQLPEIMIVDMEMPRMDGFTLIRRIRAQQGEAVPPFIIVGSRDDEHNREMARSLGAVMFLAKPYDDKQLQEAVQAAGLRLPDLTIA